MGGRDGVTGPTAIRSAWNGAVRLGMRRGEGVPMGEWEESGEERPEPDGDGRLALPACRGSGEPLLGPTPSDSQSEGSGEKAASPDSESDDRGGSWGVGGVGVKTRMGVKTGRPSASRRSASDAAVNAEEAIRADAGQAPC